MSGLITEVAPGIYLGHGTEVNWYLLVEGTDVTLIDAGYPGDAERVVESVRAIGRRPEDIRALLLTHAHVDHMGAANTLHDTYGTPVFTDSVEAAHARREHLEQANTTDVLRNLWRPGVLPWLLKITRVGVTRDIRIPSATAFPTDGVLDLPGHPVPVPTRGHTSGHTVYHLPAAGVVLTGDELVTGHALLRHAGPQCLPAFFNHGDQRAAISLIGEIDADLILPGHGEPLHQSTATAAQAALS